ncbi:class E sortase [Catenulispora subtropica]|uniref:Sortase n=1 Tax=Catenulispora subtropica TaxID=450798 RepID=A0ABN2RKW8_9ACTN
MTAPTAPTASAAAAATGDPGPGDSSGTTATLPGAGKGGGTGTGEPEGAAASVVASPEPAPSAPRPQARVADSVPASRAGRGLRVARTVAASATLASGLLLGFGVYAYGLTGLQEQHSQANLYRELDSRLSDATAPTGPAADGAPLAIVDIPAIGLHQTVVVEGTTGADLARGPGHLRDTVLPGQDGVSVLLGRRGTFGAPFAHLTRLKPGDKINVTTGQGQFSYTVNAFGEGSRTIHDAFKDRLVLATGDSTWIPTHVVYVGARLDGAPAPVAGHRVKRGDLDKPLASDTDAWPALQLWALALVFAVALTVWLVSVWNRRAVYLSAAPVLAALLWCVYENAALLLPNLY